MLQPEQRRGELVVLRPAPWRRICVWCGHNAPAWVVNPPPDGPAATTLLGLSPCPRCQRRDPETVRRSARVVLAQAAVVSLVSGLALVVLPLMVWGFGWMRGGVGVLGGVVGLNVAAALLVGGTFGVWEARRVLSIAARAVKLGEVG